MEKTLSPWTFFSSLTQPEGDPLTFLIRYSYETVKYLSCTNYVRKVAPDILIVETSVHMAKRQSRVWWTTLKEGN